MFSSGQPLQSANISGSPTFVTSSFTGHDSYLLTSGSTGHLAGSDGKDVGIYAIGPVTYGPQ